MPLFHPKSTMSLVKPGMSLTILALSALLLAAGRASTANIAPRQDYADIATLLRPSIAQTVSSLNETDLVYPPQTHVKYSNAAIGVVGYVLEKKNNQPFVTYLKHAVLEPLGLQHSSFAPEPAITANLAKAEMWSYD